MQKLTIVQASEHFNVSKEAIHNRIRRGTLNCIIENGIKYVVLDNNTQKESSENKMSENINDKYYSYIEEENRRLKEKVEKLEGETKSLRDQKEQMLIDERDKIEQIYKERDKQLKSVLDVVANKFLAHITPEQLIHEVESEEEAKHIEEAEVVEPKPKIKTKEKWVSLKKFLKDKNLSKKKYEKVQKRFIKASKKDERLKVEGTKIYTQPTKFDYADLLK